MKRLPLAVALLCAALCALAPAAGAAPGDHGVLRLAHLSPDTPAGDVYVDSVSDPSMHLTFPGVAYGMVSDYQDVPPGTYTISMRSQGAAPDSPPILSATVDVAPGTARTVAGLGYFADLGLKVLDDDLTLPPAGQARVRVINASAHAPELDASLADGTPVTSGLPFATASDYVDVPGGPTTLTVTPAGGTPMQLPVDLAAGSVYTALVLDDGSGLTVQTTLDAASMGAVPVGGVETGAGGTAGGSGRTTWLAAALGAAAVAVLGLRAVPGRRRTPRHTARS
ncbi:DUF4397 domain-containing protein [Geodermatophilus sp. TF02-6]|uniref:DUF4397 domain-containing protein n=1 Tax=Geodermatophilus sp. TF02-6 TaxID=2250575 RepID=UPI000DE8F7EB|nr:DUF4397 domain-containing protein [Geodermatophilus sp. TF02-6]RBY79772.1 DUF4397 domain-containing protein [Geodermatophilus sp. TF02-6]